MAGSKVRIDQMADEIMKGLTEYADLATDEMKSAVKKAGKTVRDEIKANAPKKTGQYASSWTAKTTLETAHSLHLTVHSPKKYQLAHLLEHGHQVTVRQGQMAHQHGEINPYQREVPWGCAPPEAVHHGLPAEEEKDQQRRNPPVLCGGTP